MKTYDGGCHCGNVRYKVTTDLAKVIECNCSHCAKKGFLLTFVPESSFRFTAQEPQLSEYLFNTKKLHHLFCPGCGVQSFARGNMPDGAAMVAINVRCLHGVDPRKLQITQVDGRSR